MVAGQRHSIVYGLHGHTEPGSASEMFVIGKYHPGEPEEVGPERVAPTAGGACRVSRTRPARLGVSP